MNDRVQASGEAVLAGLPLSDIDATRASGRERPFDMDDDNAVAFEILGRLDASYTESRVWREIEWDLNFRYAFDGDQWVEWNSVIEEMLPHAFPGEERATENQLIGMVIHAAAQIINGSPAYEVASIPDNHQGRQSAKAGKKLLHAKMQQKRMGRQFHFVALDTLTCGFGVSHGNWNPHGGAISNDGKGYVGTVDATSISPWQFFPQIGLEEPTLDKADWCIQLSWASPAQLQRKPYKFNPDYGFFDLPRKYHVSGPSRDLYVTHNGVSGDGRVLCVNYYQKPKPVKGFERGLFAVVCGNQVVYKGPLQRHEREKASSRRLPRLPFQIYPWTPRRGSFYCRPWLSDLRGPQDVINQSLSHALTHVSIFSGPDLAIDSGTKYTSGAEGIGFREIEVPPGMRDPRFIVPPAASPEILNFKAIGETGLNKVGMQFPLSRGQHQQNIPSGFYAQVQQEADAVDMQPVALMHAIARQELAEDILCLFRDYDVKESIAITGPNGRFALQRFKANDLPESITVQVDEQTMFSRSVAARAAQVLELVGNGIFDGNPNMDPRAIAQILKWVDAPGLTEVKDTKWLERQLATRNHCKIIDEGKLPELDPMWPFDTLLIEAGMLRWEDEAEQWPPETQQLFAQYVAALEQAIAEQQQSAFQAARAQQQQMLQDQMAADSAEQESRAKLAIVKAAAGGASTMAEPPRREGGGEQ